MQDPRIHELKQATEKMADGQFRVEVHPAMPGDDVDELGASITRLAETLDRRFSEMRKISVITEKINAGLLLDEVLEFVYTDFASVIPYDRIGFALLEDEGHVLRARWAKTSAARMEITKGYYQDMHGSSLQKILTTGKPRIINDLEDYLSLKPDSDSTHRIVAEGMRSSLTCPLVARGHPVGFMFFSSTKKNTYAHAHVEIFESIAGQLSVILEKSRLYQELLELNDLKTRFLGMAAHDLRNPLTVISAYLQLMEMQGMPKSETDYRTMLGEMSKSCELMINMIKTYLDVSAIESGRIELDKGPVELKGFVSDLERAMRVLSDAKNMQLKMELEAGLSIWVFDAYRIRQVVENLVSNAVKYSPAGKSIAVSFRGKEGNLEISVADEGQGIPDSDIPKLFKDFSRASTKPTAGESSTGLGLAICRRLVNLHGGHISVKSIVGKGSTFTVMLPKT